MLAITVPYINPIITELGPIAIRWYSLAYIFGIFLGIMHFKQLAKIAKLDISQDFIDDLITGAVIGIVVGGRLGYVLIYDPSYYFSHPLEIIKTWVGGMSFHGGFIGFCLATIIVCRIHLVPLFSALDLAACCAPIGIFLGRLANFINGELYGRKSDVAWAIIVKDTDDVPRHPSQLYEAFSEGVLLLLILNIAFYKFKLYKTRGMLSGIFCILYALFRFISELYRQPDEQLGFIFTFLTMGQILSAFMLIIGIVVIRKSLNRDI